jgi:hypothetical protein
MTWACGRRSRRRDIADEVVIELLVEPRANGVRRIGPKERIAVRGRAHDSPDAEIAGALLGVLPPRAVKRARCDAAGTRDQAALVIGAYRTLTPL